MHGTVMWLFASRVGHYSYVCFIAVKLSCLALTQPQNYARTNTLPLVFNEKNKKQELMKLYSEMSQNESLPKRRH